jgi:hypothetical protein
MEIPSKDGKPIITNAMKAECIGEFQVEIPCACQMCAGEGCDDCGETGWGLSEIEIPWTTIKYIYKRMAVASQSNATNEARGNNAR